MSVWNNVKHLFGMGKAGADELSNQAVYAAAKNAPLLNMKAAIDAKEKQVTLFRNKLIDATRSLENDKAETKAVQNELDAIKAKIDQAGALYEAEKNEKDKAQIKEEALG